MKAPGSILAGVDHDMDTPVDLPWSFIPANASRTRETMPPFEHHHNINLWNDCCKVVVQKLFALGRKARRTNNNNNVNMEYSDKR